MNRMEVFDADPDEPACTVSVYALTDGPIPGEFSMVALHATYEESREDGQPGFDSFFHGYLQPMHCYPHDQYRADLEATGLDWDKLSGNPNYAMDTMQGFWKWLEEIRYSRRLTLGFADNQTASFVTWYLYRFLGKMERAGDFGAFTHDPDMRLAWARTPEDLKFTGPAGAESSR